jgi:hypothetical protein
MCETQEGRMPEETFDKERVWQYERTRINTRRAAMQLPEAGAHDRADAPPSGSPQAGQPADTIGLSLSGGGIRSATFCLGVMRGLAQRHMLECVDYLSTVSGGGYIGAFFGSLFVRNAPGADANYAYNTLRAPISRPDDQGGTTAVNEDSGALWWLRNSGRYLAPGGAGDYIYALALAVRNVLAVHYVVGLSVLLATCVAYLIDVFVVSHANSGGDPVMIIFGGRFVLFYIDNFPFIDYELSLAQPLPPSGMTFLVAATAMAAAWILPMGLAYFGTEMPKPRPVQQPAPENGAPYARILSACRAGWHTHISANPIAWRYTYAFFWMAAMGVVILVGALVCWGVSARIAEFVDVSQIGVRRFAYACMAVAVVILLALWFFLRATRYVQDGKHFPRGSVPPSQWQTNAEYERDKMRAVRVELTKRLADAFKWTLAVAAIGAVMLAAWWLTCQAPPIGSLITLGSIGSFLIAITKWALDWYGARKTAKGGGLPLSLIMWIAGLLLAAIVCLFWVALTWRAAAALSDAPTCARFPPYWALGTMLVCAAFLTYVTGRSLQFINLSTIQNLYASRLVRAYLGASNISRRTQAGHRWLAISDAHPQDDLSLEQYYAAQDAPLHIINVTLNETVSPVATVVQRDRHGRPMALSPCAVHVDRYAYPYNGGPAGASAEPAEALSLGAWTGISGAAFSTGIGRATSLGQSLLTGLANVRLGYWWRAGRMQFDHPDARRRSRRPLITHIATQSYLAAELFCRYTGPYAPYWYLSDGGHFDNTGIYELLRRRVGIILAVDSAADPDYEWGDLGNLMRVARIDFGCEFEEVHAPAVAQNAKLSALMAAKASSRETRGKDCIRLFRVRHAPDAGGGHSLLVVIKPRVLAAAPLDVQQYAGASEPFPQETTADQFFSEEQWESYRKLGETIGVLLAEAISSGTYARTHLNSLFALREALK